MKLGNMKCGCGLLEKNHNTLKNRIFVIFESQLSSLRIQQGI